MRKENKTEVVSLTQVGIAGVDHRLFQDLNLSIQTGERIIIRGPSGSGKSSLLRLIAGQEAPDEGRIIRRNKRAELVSSGQEDGDAPPNWSIRDYFLEARGLRTLEIIMRQLEDKMAKEETSQSTLDRYGDIVDQYQEKDGYSAEAEIQRVLDGLRLSINFTGHITLDSRLNQVSSGQRTRLAIGRALFSDADILLLDDPTAHLDVQSVDWFCQTVSQQTEKAVVISTNDDRITSSVATRVVQIEEGGRVFSYTGDLEEFEIKRMSQIDADRTEVTVANKKYLKLKATYEKFKGEGRFRKSANFAQVGRAMQTRLERMKQELSRMPGLRVQISHPVQVKDAFVDVSHQQLSDSSIVIDGVSKTYEGRGGVDTTHLGKIRIRRGEKLLISGENGSGKSTLLRMIADQVSDRKVFVPESGRITFDKRLKVAYLAPDQDNVSSQGPILDEVVNAMPSVNESLAIRLLASVGFNSKKIRQQRIETLSASEGQQLAVAKVLAQSPDVMILDEPTSNLKPEIKRRLAKALNKYQGSLILVDHDPVFTAQINVTNEVNLW